MNHMALRERINSFAELKDNWDSYGSRPIDPRAIEAAKQIIGGWQAVPMNGGGVQLEIHCPAGEIEIEIGPDGVVKWAGAFDKDCNILKED